MNKKNLFILAAAAIILLVGVGLYLFWPERQESVDVATEREWSEKGVLGNPLEEMPSTNPFEEVVNPFEDAYKNPFKE